MNDYLTLVVSVLPWVATGALAVVFILLIAAAALAFDEHHWVQLAIYTLVLFAIPIFGIPALLLWMR